MDIKNYEIYLIVGLVLLPIFLLYIGVDILITFPSATIISAIFFGLKKIKKNNIFMIILLYMIIIIIYSFYFSPSVMIAKGQGTVLSDNWFQALNWIKNNTKECAVIATYWDPGHFITGIAERPVIFDGASQGATLLLNTSNYNYIQGLTTENYDNGIVQIISVKGDKLYRGRIKDVGISLLTNNESLALKYMKDYKKPGCDEMYYIASSDLIGKSVWWSYFATWDPINKGKMYSYAFLQSPQARPIPSQNVITYTYSVAPQQAFVLYESDGNIIKAFLQQGSQFLTIEKIFFFTKEGMGIIKTEPNAEVKGTIWVTPDKSVSIYMPPELENSMFTKLFFFHGQGLQHYQFINSWGGEIKLFKINFNETVSQ